MASKSIAVGAREHHGHCNVCGTCLMFRAQIHRCPEEIDPEVLAVFLSDQRPQDVRVREPLPNGFQVVRHNAAGCEY